MAAALEEERLIPEEVVSFDDMTPYHENEMYKTMVRYYIGLETRAIAMNTYKMNQKRGDIVKGSFPKKEEIDPSYRAEEEKYTKIEFPIKEDVDFIYLGSYACYFFLCMRTIHVFKKDKTIFVCAEQGDRYLDIHDFGQVYNDIIQQETPFNEVGWEIPIRYKNFLEMLFSIKNELMESNQIVFMGHSNGMASSIISAFLFCCIKNENFIKKYKRNIIDNNTDFFFQLIKGNEIWDAIKRITIFVVGSGGFPVLFETNEEFKNFYDELQGRYVHIVNGFTSVNGDMYVDYYASEIYYLYTVKFGLYYIKDIRRLEDIIKNRKKYSGIQFSGGIFINDVSSDWERVENVQNRHRIWFKNKHTGIASYIPEFVLKDKFKFLGNVEGHKNLHSFSTYRDMISIYFFS